MIPDKPALVAGCLRVPTDASGQTRVACTLRSLGLAGWGGAQRAAAWGPRGDPGSGGGPTRGARLPVAQTQRRQLPPPTSRQFAGSLRLFSKTYRSVQLIFFLKFGDQNKNRRKILCECQKWPQIGALRSIGNQIFAVLRS